MKKTISNWRYQVLIEWLKQGRTNLGLTMRELGERLGVPHSFVQKTEILERRLDVVEYIAYCQALGLEPEEGIQLMLKKEHEHSSLQPKHKKHTRATE